MRVVLAVFADFEQAPFGRSRLLEDLNGRPILDRTLAAALRVTAADEVFLVVSPRDAEPAAAAVARHAGVQLLTCDSGERPRRRLMRTARKWSLDAWRGGLLGATWFDEFLEPLEVGRVLDATRADAVLCIEGHQPGFDPVLGNGVIETQRERSAEAEFIFDQAPPGLSGPVLTRKMAASLIESQAPFGIVLAYRPEAPRMDLITKPMCRRIDSTVIQTQARFVADTDISCARLSGALAAVGDEADAMALAGWARAHPLRAAALPVEVELELTTGDPLPESTLRARGARIPTRMIADAGSLDALAGELGACDDRLVWLGGHGDPLAHPAFGEICTALRAAGVFGLGLATPLVDLTPPQLEAIFGAPLDVVEVQLDANTAETYRRVHGADRFEQVLAHLDTLHRNRQIRQSPQPILTCSMTRCAATFDEIEGFFDRWIATVGWAVLRGYGTLDGTLAPDALPGTTPPIRAACRRLASRLTLLADGRAVACSEDPRGRQELGRWDSETLTAIWRGDARGALREAHQDGRTGSLPVCGGCRQWHLA